MAQTPFAGIFPYLVSPVDPDGSIREKPLRELVSSLIDAGVHGLTPLGSTGEFFYLTWEQRRRIVEIVLDEARGRVPVVPGVGSAATGEAVRQAREFEAMGADGILSILCAYFPLGPREARGYFASVAQSVSCPVVLYNNPRFSGFAFTPDLLEELCGIPNIRYYKDAAGDTGKLLEIANRVGGRLKLFSASAHVPVFVMMLGGVGWMSGPACLIPRQSVRLYNLCVQKRWEEAMELQRRLWDMNRLFQKYGLARCVKAGLELQGFDVGGPIPPNAPLSVEAKMEIAGVLRALQP